MQEKIYLRPLCLNDVSEKYLSWVNDPYITEYLGIGKKCLKYQDLVKYVEDSPKNGRYNFAVITKNSKNHIGNCSIYSINQENKKFEIGWFIGDKNFWGGALFYHGNFLFAQNWIFKNGTKEMHWIC